VLDGMDWMHPVQGRDKTGSWEHNDESSGSTKGGEFLN
jgi:hypothetical protein